MGSYSKTDFRAKIRIFRPKKNVHFLFEIMFKPRPGKVVQRKSTRFPKKIIYLADFRCFLGVGNQIFGVFSVFRQKGKPAASPLSGTKPKPKKMQNFEHKMGHGSQPEARLATGSTQ